MHLHILRRSFVRRCQPGDQHSIKEACNQQHKVLHGSTTQAKCNTKQFAAPGSITKDAHATYPLHTFTLLNTAKFAHLAAQKNAHNPANARHLNSIHQLHADHRRCPHTSAVRLVGVCPGWVAPAAREGRPRARLPGAILRHVGRSRADPAVHRRPHDGCARRLRRPIERLVMLRRQARVGACRACWASRGPHGTGGAHARWRRRARPLQRWPPKRGLRAGRKPWKPMITLKVTLRRRAGVRRKAAERRPRGSAAPCASARWLNQCMHMTSEVFNCSTSCLAWNCIAGYSKKSNTKTLLNS